jgi:hypothetical protein
MIHITGNFETMKNILEGYIKENNVNELEATNILLSKCRISRRDN